MSYSIIEHDSYETGFMYDKREQFLIDSEDDVENLPDNCAPGSAAFMTNDSRAWQMNSSKTWCEVKSVSALKDTFSRKVRRCDYD